MLHELVRTTIYIIHDIEAWFNWIAHGVCGGGGLVYCHHLIILPLFCLHRSQHLISSCLCDDALPSKPLSSLPCVTLLLQATLTTDLHTSSLRILFNDRAHFL